MFDCGVYIPVQAAELIRDNLDVYESHMREMRDTLEIKLKVGVV